MNCPWAPEELELLLSCYLDGELDLATRMELESWLRTNPEGRERLERLRVLAAAVAGLHPAAAVPAGWTVKAYALGLPGQPPLKRRMYLGLGQAAARPSVHGHGLGLFRAVRRWRLGLRHRT